MEELLGRYYLAETALFYSGFELNEKKRKIAFFKADRLFQRFRKSHLEIIYQLPSKSLLKLSVSAPHLCLHLSHIVLYP